MQLTFDQTAELLDEIAESFPPPLFGKLNGGVNFLDEVRSNPEFEDVYTMGEYCCNNLRRYINLYYGSFCAMARIEDWNLDDWRKNLRRTFSHELTHHMESRAGAADCGKLFGGFGCERFAGLCPCENSAAAASELSGRMQKRVL